MSTEVTFEVCEHCKGVGSREAFSTGVEPSGAFTLQCHACHGSGKTVRKSPRPESSLQPERTIIQPWMRRTCNDLDPACSAERSETRDYIDRMVGVVAVAVEFHRARKADVNEPNAIQRERLAADNFNRELNAYLHESQLVSLDGPEATGRWSFIKNRYSMDARSCGTCHAVEVYHWLRWCPVGKKCECK